MLCRMLDATDVPGRRIAPLPGLPGLPGLPVLVFLLAALAPAAEARLTPTETALSSRLAERVDPALLANAGREAPPEARRVIAGVLVVAGREADARTLLRDLDLDDCAGRTLAAAAGLGEACPDLPVQELPALEPAPEWSGALVVSAREDESAMDLLAATAVTALLAAGDDQATRSFDARADRFRVTGAALIEGRLVADDRAVIAVAPRTGPDAARRALDVFARERPEPPPTDGRATWRLGDAPPSRAGAADADATEPAERSRRAEVPPTGAASGKVADARRHADGGGRFALELPSDWTVETTVEATGETTAARMDALALLARAPDGPAGRDGRDGDRGARGHDGSDGAMPRVAILVEDAEAPSNPLARRRRADFPAVTASDVEAALPRGVTLERFRLPDESDRAERRVAWRGAEGDEGDAVILVTRGRTRRVILVGLVDAGDAVGAEAVRAAARSLTLGAD